MGNTGEPGLDRQWEEGLYTEPLYFMIYPVFSKFVWRVWLLLAFVLLRLIL